MKSRALNIDSHINPHMATTNSTSASSEIEITVDQLASTESQYLKIDLEDFADSDFSSSEMAAAEQLVQLSDYSDCNTATSTGCCNRRIGNEKNGDETEGEERSEISSSCSAVKMKIEEIFGRFDENGEHCEEREDNRSLRKRRKKYGSLAEIYKISTPLVGYRSQAPLKGSMIKKVRYS